MTSDTRLFIGRLSQSVQKRDLEDLFGKYGKVVNCSLKTTYGFVEFEDPHDARDALRELDGYRLEGNMIAVEYSHGRKSERDRDDRDFGRNRDRDYERDYDRDYDRDSDRNFGREDRRDYDRRDYDRRDYDRRDYDRRDYDRRDSERDFDRGGFGRRYGRRGRYSPPYNTKYRLTVTGLPQGCSWQDLKDHFRQIGEVCFADVRRDREGKEKGIVEFKHRQDMRDAVRKLDKSRIRGSTISIICEYQGGSTSRSRSASREKSPVRKSRSKSPKSLSRSPNPESRNNRSSPRKSRSHSPPKNGTGDNFGKYHSKSESNSPLTGSPTTTGKSEKSEKQSHALEDL